MSYRILIADDHAIVRRGIKAILESQLDTCVCGEASTGRQAIELAQQLKPDLALIDLTMPVLDGLAATRAILQSSPTTEILILSMHCGESLVRSVLQAGAQGYILKSEVASELPLAVRNAREHKPYFSPSLIKLMVDAFTSPTTHEDRPSVRGLSERETQIVRLLASGLSNKQVAGALGVSTRTIESHRSRVKSKLKLRCFSELVRFAVRSNLIE